MSQKTLPELKRMVYSPKAYVFIRRANGDSIDVSDDVVGGSITRNINDVSTATVMLRNPGFKYSPRHSEPKFLPMDGITIWMERVAGRPIQVFTGYIDSVPYYQMYPDNCVIEASCTLKKLKYTYFDPGTVAMQQWFTQHGWQMDGQGGFISPTALGNTGRMDAGFGNLLQKFLHDVCRWDPRAIWIGDLPSDLPQIATNLLNRVQKFDANVEQELQTFLSGLMGISVNPIPDASVQQATNVFHASAPVAASLSTVSLIKQIASEQNIDPILLITASILLTNLNPQYTDPQLHRAGLFAVKDNHSSGPTGGGGGDRNRNYNDPTFAINDYIKKIRSKYRSDSKLSALTNHNLPWAATLIGTIYEEGSHEKPSARNAGIAQIPARIKDARDRAHSLISALSAASTNSGGIYQTQLDSITITDMQKELPDIVDRRKISAVYGGHSTSNDLNKLNRLAAFIWVACKGHSLHLLRQWPEQGIDPTVNVQFTGAERSLKSFVDWAKKQKDSGIDYVSYQNSVIRPAHRPGQAGPAAQADSVPHVTLIIKPGANFSAPKWNGPVPVAVFSDQSQQQPGAMQDNANIKVSDLSRLSETTDIVGQFSLPWNMAESMLLTGRKALMNDIPVLECVDQLCKASMRSYMSAPSGEFVAFFPDYFGAYGRQPYWRVTDVEIVDMSIQLSDANLQTHVYVNGTWPAPVSGSGIDQISNELFSAGVVNISDVMGATNFISNLPGTPADPLAKEHQVDKFLTRYGARPLKINSPLIRSRMFEFLSAWNVFMYYWASQFNTTISLTFQPEIMAGGRVEFYGHDLEVFVDSVTHSWDYEGGFMTTVQINAPASTNPDRYPGFAMAGTSDIVGPGYLPFTMPA